MTKYPYWLIIKFYWFRLLTVSTIWFIYDFSTYSFGLYSSSWLTIILGDTYPLWVSFGWNTVINLFCKFSVPCAWFFKRTLCWKTVAIFGGQPQLSCRLFNNLN